MFVELLHGASGFLFQQALSKLAKDVLILAEKLFSHVKSLDSWKDSPLFASIENFLAIAGKAKGINGRLQALGREMRVIDILQKSHDNPAGVKNA